MFEKRPAIAEAVTKLFTDLDKDPDVSGFKVLNEKEEPLVEVKRQEFADVAKPIAEDAEPEPLPFRETTEQAHLNIVRLSFDSVLKSNFILSGRKFEAKIEDPEFYKRVRRGESFAQGDVLVVELRWKQAYDATFDTYVTKSQQIVRVVRHIPRVTQQSLFEIPETPRFEKSNGGQRALKSAGKKISSLKAKKSAGSKSTPKTSDEPKDKPKRGK